jgi:S1-C subfamily serine protease/HEAT repeat protein
VPQAAEPLPLDDDEEEESNEVVRRPKKKSGTNPLLVVGIVLFLVVAIGGGVAAWYVYGQKPQPVAEVTSVKDKEKEPEKTKTSTTVEPPKTLTGEQVYKKLLPSTVFILTPDGSLGSGVMVHRDRRLVLTNHHVIRDHTRSGVSFGALVLFPVYDDKKNLITSVDYYVKNSKQVGIHAHVLESQPKKDLAILELERVPEDARPVVISPNPAGTGANVFSIGASGIDRNLLWKLSSGLVTGRSERQVKTTSGNVSGIILETSAGVNPGDSGGPVVNDRAELVGVVAHFDRSSRDVSGNIDVEEVRQFLEGVASKGGWVWVGESPSASETTPAATASNEPDDVGKLITQLKDPDAETRLTAAKRLAELGSKAHAAFPDLLARLDEPDERVQKAAADALEHIGSLSAAEIGALDNALKSGPANARSFALKYYSTNPAHKVPEELLPVVVKTLGDATGEGRKMALRILVNYGPGCKPKALTAVLEHIADEDPTIASEALRLFASFAPFREQERPALVGSLTSAKATVRLATTIVLTSEAPDATVAMEWFRPRLSDSDARVRGKAIEALVKWGVKVKDALPDLLLRLEDDTLIVALAALKAAVLIDGGPTVVEAIAKVLASKDSRTELKAAAIDTVLNLDLKDAEKAIPVLVQLMNQDKVSLRLAALAKLAKFGTEAKPALEAITARLKDEDNGVKIAALKALSPFGGDAAAAIPGVADLLDGKQPDNVATAAAETLPKLGPKAIEPLIKALNSKLCKEALSLVCEGLGQFGKEAQAAGQSLLDARTRQVALRNLADQAANGALAQNIWNPDPVAAALVKIGGDDKLVKQLLDMTSYETKTINGVKKRVASKSDGAMVWAIYVLDSFNQELMTDKGKDQVAEQLSTLATYAPTPACREAAKTARAKYPMKK